MTKTMPSREFLIQQSVMNVADHQSHATGVPYFDWLRMVLNNPFADRRLVFAAVVQEYRRLRDRHAR